MWLHAPLLLPLLLLVLLPLNVTARFCEGGHICTLPRECCTQGCCPPYQGGPRQLPPPSEHVLNLFFISHWFFWCVVVAVILAILCAYSLWKKRRTLCGWGFNEHHTQSEGDSAGSCYAPPQYSRCNSFHHPPPPYTEVTSKPDLYPLVFTCNSDNGKGNGSSSYLMVQYFRNYIVRPAGSLSAASTVDSLSSSFICNANEANTLVPPPYSRAASPELGLHHYVTHAPGPPQPPPLSQSQLMAGQYGLPRSASQLVDNMNQNTNSTNTAQLQGQQGQQGQHYATVALGGGGGVIYSTRLQSSQSGNFSPEETVRPCVGMSGVGVAAGGMGPGMGYHLQSQSDQHFRYMATSSSSLSDIFVNNSCVAGLGANIIDGIPTSGTATQAASLSSLAAGGTPVIYSNGCIQPNPLHNLDNCCQLSGNVGSGSGSGGGGGISGTTASSAASGVSSLANIGTPSSPPQATSPTGEVREILDQIRQLQAGVSYEQLLLAGVGGGGGGGGGGLGGGGTAITTTALSSATGTKPRLQHTLSTPAATNVPTASSASISASSSMSGKSKKFYAPKPPNKALYIPMSALVTSSNASGSSGAQRCVLKSPVSSVVSGASFFVNRGRVARKGWISRSAPTTPGSGLPPNRLGDDSPLLLNEHDEDVIEDDDEDDDNDDDDDDDDDNDDVQLEALENSKRGARAKINNKTKAQSRNRSHRLGHHHNELE